MAPDKTSLCRVLAFDYGTQRIGVAVGQVITRTASPLAPLTSRSGKPDWPKISGLVAEWSPDGFVVGLPLYLDGSDSEMARYARRFGRQLSGRYNLPCFWVNEGLSSDDAERQLGGGNDSSHRRLSVDSMAAALILESWFAESGG